MAGLQRSQVSFRRQGSSGLVWDDRFLSGELNQEGKPQENQENSELKQHATTTTAEAENKHVDVRDIPPIKTIDRSRSSGGGGRGYRTGRVSPAVDPPSPKVSACGCCSAFGKASESGRRKTANKRRSR